MRTTIGISTIRMKTDMQVRKALSAEAVNQYATEMSGGQVFPAIVVYEDDDGERWLADGWHRVEAAKKLGRTEIEAEIRHGTRRDALLCAASANLSHGLRMTPADRKHAAMLMLKDDEWRCWSSREIGRRCGLDGKTIERLRRNLSAENPQMRKVQRRGKVYEQNTGNNGVALHESGKNAQPSSPKAMYETIVISPWWNALSDEALKTVPVRDLAAPNCTLVVATTSTRIAKVLDIVRVWGFTIVDVWTGLVEPRKANAVLTNKENHFVVAERGKFPCELSSTLTARAFPPGDMEELLRIVVNARCPGRKLELFAKTAADGWTCLNERLELVVPSEGGVGVPLQM